MKFRKNNKTSYMTMVTLYLSLFISGFCLASSAFADLILAAPPRENAAQGDAIYKPIAESLSTLLGQRVVYEQPRGWFDYTNKMRANKYDIVFDGPHFAAWRLKHLKHTPLVSLPGELRFVLIVSKDETHIKKLRQLNGKKICGMLSPNLGTGLVFEEFTNPVLQPEIYEVKGEMRAVYAAFKQGKCTAAILRKSAFDNLPAADRKSSRILFTTRGVPNQTITISDRIETQAKKIQDFMISKNGAIAADNLLTRYSKKAQFFVPADKNDYTAMNKVIEGVVYGW